MTDQFWIVDDPTKSQAEVESAMVREKLRRCYERLIALDSKSRIVVAQTPLREHDPYSDLFDKYRNQH